MVKLRVLQKENTSLEKPSSVPVEITTSYSIILSLAISQLIIFYYQLRTHLIIQIILIFVFTSISVIVDKYKKNMLCYLVLFGLFLSTVLINSVLDLGLIKGIKDVYEWCFIYNGDDVLYNRGYAITVVIGMIWLCCTINYVIHHYKRVKTVISIIMPVLLLLSALHAITVPKVTIGCALFYTITEIVDFCGNCFYRTGKINQGIATVYLAPVCIIIVVIAISLPSHPEPIKWNGIKNIYYKIQEQSAIFLTKIEYFFDKTGSEFAVSFSGYSDEGSDDLGGNVHSSDNTSLLVTTHNQSNKRGYLIGSISDYYTGHSWEKSTIETNLKEQDYFYDFYELLLALTKGYNLGSDMSNVIKKTNYDIEYYNIRTRSLFYPLKTVEISSRKSYKYKETGQGAFLYHKARTYGTKYDVLFYELNLNDEAIINILREAKKEPYIPKSTELYLVAKDILNYNTGSKIDIPSLIDELSKRSEMIHKYYTRLPESLPDRVKELAFVITKDYTSNYDKLKALEAYLNTMTYTTRVSKTPKGEDFVDYFLFEQKEGYCTYYATAMCVLARTIGIPTRYVEGFVVDSNETDNKSIVKVLSKHAHSWVDAYIDGVGWIPFEPTPTFYDGRYTPWKSPYLNYGNQTSYKYQDDYLMDQEHQEWMNSIIDQEDDLMNKNNTFRYILIIVTTVFSIVLLFVGIIFIYYVYLTNKYDKRLKNSTDDVKLSMILAEILKYAETEGYKFSEEDTLLSYADKISDKLFFTTSTFLEIVHIFMEVRYGEFKMKEEKVNRILLFRDELRNHLISKYGKRKMFFMRFAFLHFYQ